MESRERAMVGLHPFLMEDGTVEAWTSTCLQHQGHTGPVATSWQSMTRVWQTPGCWLGCQELEGWRVRLFREKTGWVSQAASSCKRQKPQPNVGHTNGNQPTRVQEMLGVAGFRQRQSGVQSHSKYLITFWSPSKGVFRFHPPS